jgi:2,3-dihydroxybiphenyl 1,2-dioxygenase
MTAVTQLGYLGIGANDLEAWKGYAVGTLGLEALAPDPDGALRLRMDHYHHRFAVHESAEEPVAYSGWEVADAEALARISQRLERTGLPVHEGSGEELEARRVSGMAWFFDPDGYRCEIYHGPQDGAGATGTGFVTGEQGLGHFVLMAQDLERTMGFYTGLLGMRVSDYVTMNGGRTKLGFLHCNPRHHSIAFVEAPGRPRGINHFMVQRENLNDVGRAYDGVQAAGIPLITTLGRHSNDEMVSFYMRNPSGWGVEYGWGGREIDDATWCVSHLDSGSTWGHHPVKAIPANG